jgi:hypothetical protein
MQHALNPLIKVDGGKSVGLLIAFATGADLPADGVIHVASHSDAVVHTRMYVGYSKQNVVEFIAAAAKADVSPRTAVDHDKQQQQPSGMAMTPMPSRDLAVDVALEGIEGKTAGAKMSMIATTASPPPSSEKSSAAAAASAVCSAETAVAAAKTAVAAAAVAEKATTTETFEGETASPILSVITRGGAKVYTQPGSRSGTRVHGSLSPNSSVICTFATVAAAKATAEYGQIPCVLGEIPGTIEILHSSNRKRKRDSDEDKEAEPPAKRVLHISL